MRYIGLVLLLICCNTYANYENNLKVDDAKDKWSRLVSSHKKNLDSFSCPQLVEAKKYFKAESIYCQSDKTRSKVCKNNELLYKKEYAKVKAFIDILSDLSSQKLRSNKENSKVTQCFVKHLNYWAKNGALSAFPQPTNQGEYVRFSTLSKVTEFYLIFSDEIKKCKNCSASKKRIFQWFKTLADATILHFEKKKNANSSKNNHRYWAGLAALNVGIATSDYKYFDWARESFLIGIKQIQRDGHLPLELQRGDMALAYHFYALTPLIAMSDKFRANGLSSPRERDRLRRLVDFSHGSYHGYKDTVLTDRKYTDNVNYCSAPMAGLEIYLKRNSRLSKNKNADLHAILLESGRNSCNTSGRIFYTALGGEVSILHGIINLDRVIYQEQ